MPLLQTGEEEEEVEEKEKEEVTRIEKMLERHGEAIKAPSANLNNPLFDANHLSIAVERVRIPEILFQVSHSLVPSPSA